MFIDVYIFCARLCIHVELYVDIQGVSYVDLHVFVTLVNLLQMLGKKENKYMEYQEGLS